MFATCARFVHFKPLFMHGHCGSLHLRLHLHENSCITVSGAGDPRIHSTVSVISDPATLDWAWDLRMSPDASLVVTMHCMHEEAVLAWWTLGRLELPTPCAEQRAVLMSTVLVDDVYNLHVNACSFLNGSTDDYQDCSISRSVS